MIIDDHVHVHEWSFSPDEDAYHIEHLIGLLDACGIDMAIIEDSLAYVGHDQEHSNDETRKAVEAYPDRLIGFANIKPQLGEKRSRQEIDRTVGEWGFRGIKLHPAVDQFPANAPMMDPVVQAAIEYDVPLWIHTGHQPYATPIQVGLLADRFPDAKIIVGHMGHDMFYDAIMAGRRYPSLYFDISQQGRHSFRAACEGLDPERLIFGSDAPYSNPAGPKALVENSSLSRDVKEKILGGTVAALIGLEAA
ncbi:MAG: amidohydrolase family protein [Hyphomicrobiales bacterium]